ncbi:UNVERIFIED_CONTAM: hypothetical protein Scaly_0421700 [Sesamum calycinum]|uniref:Uncharacterized protein n=1 Tax=Sesamum calycinum TaxID=2727403 RepID=A0AAW2SG57_9LAMI
MATARLPTNAMLRSAPQSLTKSAFVKSPVSLGSVKSIAKTFGLKTKPDFRTTMAVYKVKLIDQMVKSVNLTHLMMLTFSTLPSLREWSFHTPGRAGACLHLCRENGVGFR